jgi:hypothetical protein
VFVGPSMFITLPIELTCTEPVPKILIVSFGASALTIRYLLLLMWMCFVLDLLEDAASTKATLSKSKPSDVLYKSLISIVSNCVSVKMMKCQLLRSDTG